MEITQIIHHFEHTRGAFARDATVAAIERREEIVPELLRILEEYVAAVETTGECESNAHLYALLLLAQFRETRAYPLALRMARLDSESLEYMLGDFVTGNLSSVLASVCGEDRAAIRSLIEDESVDEWVRWAAIDSLVILVGQGVDHRSETVAYFKELLGHRLKREPSVVWDGLVNASTDLYPEEVMEEIERAFAEDLVDPQVMGLDDMRRDLAFGRDFVLHKLAHDPHEQFVHDTVAEMESWAWEEAAKTSDLLQPSRKTGLEPAVRLSPIWRTAPKVGRNEPCPCGSGKKYKKCCLP